MKEKVLEYSVLRYSPSTGERINLGILFNEQQMHFMDFKFTKSLTRLSRFDDEININMVRLLLASIKEEVDYFSGIPLGKFEDNKYIIYNFRNLYSNMI